MTFQLRVRDIRDVGPNLRLISVDPQGSPITERYARVGQYVTLASRETEPGYFSIASAPRENELSFLIRIEPGKPKTEALARVAIGDYLSISEPTGPGYPLELQHGRDLLLLAAGTGIAPLRALIRELLRSRADYARVTLIYGAADEASLAFREEFDTWRAAGIDVRVVLSRAEEEWNGLRGYVQDHLGDLDLHPERTSAFVCGRPEITHAVHAALRGVGLADERIFENQ